MITPDEYMSSPVITSKPEDTVEALSKLMDLNNIGSIVIVVDGRIAGIVTERDLVRKVLSKNKEPADVLAKDVMTKTVHTVAKDATLMEVAALMKKHTMRRLVVVDAEQPVGIITSRDIISLLVE